jgi:heme-degrading monooxygenase HmoA
MIRVIIERQLKSGEDLGLLLGYLNMMAALKKGHLSSEMLINSKDNRLVAVLSSWEQLEDWEKWAESDERTKIINHIEPLLAQKARVDIYAVMSPNERAFFEDPGGWMQAHEHPHFEG